MKNKVPRRARAPKLFALPGRVVERGIEWGERGKFYATAIPMNDTWHWAWRVGDSTPVSGTAPDARLCVALMTATVEKFERQIQQTLVDLQSVRNPPPPKRGKRR